MFQQMVFGAIISSKTDAAIVGQSYVNMSKSLDYICPMIYPSHYADGAYGIKYPDLEPYYLILKSLEQSASVLMLLKKDNHKAVVRPWLQDFTASWVPTIRNMEQKKSVHKYKHCMTQVTKSGFYGMEKIIYKRRLNKKK